MIAQNDTTDSFMKELQSLWHAEKLLTDALPRMMALAFDFGLRQNLAMHFAETDQHKVAVEAICKQLGFDHEGTENEAMQSIIAAGEEAMSGASGDALDEAIILCAIRVEHY